MNVPTGQSCPPSIGMVAAFNWNPWPGSSESAHDGYRLMARRDPVGIRLLTRNGNDWSIRFPLVAEAVNHLKVRSCLIDGEVV